MSTTGNSKSSNGLLDVLKHVESHARRSVTPKKREAKPKPQRAPQSKLPPRVLREAPTPPPKPEPVVEGGCSMCGKDDDHSHLLLCETCNAECHTYCLIPPLRAVPKEAWYCDACRPEEGDGLERLVSGLSPEFTSQFGEIIWANGGAGYGWWPAAVYDPRLTVGVARQEARKYLGKRHLIYFIECEEAPFDVLDAKKLAPWYEGFAYDYHLGKAAKNHGKKRYTSFLSALQAATIEEAKPVAQRFDWKHEGDDTILPSPRKQSGGGARSGSASKRAQDDSLNLGREGKQKRRRTGKKPSAAQNLRFEEPPDLFCRISRIQSSETVSSEGVSGHITEDVIGFIKLPNRDCTFEDARASILEDLVPEELEADFDWKFYIESLGTVSRKQESTLGPILTMLRHAQAEEGCDGSIIRPVRLKLIASNKKVSNK